MKKILVVLLCLFMVGCNNVPASKGGKGVSIKNSSNTAFHVVEVIIKVDGNSVRHGTHVRGDVRGYEKGSVFLDENLDFPITSQKVELEISCYYINNPKHLASVSSSTPKTMIGSVVVDITGVNNWIELELLDNYSIVILDRD